VQVIHQEPSNALGHAKRKSITVEFQNTPSVVQLDAEERQEATVKVSEYRKLNENQN